MVRNTVTRRLRELVRSRWGQLPPGTLLVVRALPAAAGAPSTTLADDLDTALARVLAQISGPVPVRQSAQGAL